MYIITAINLSYSTAVHRYLCCARAKYDNMQTYIPAMVNELCVNFARPTRSRDQPHPLLQSVVWVWLTSSQFQTDQWREYAILMPLFSLVSAYFSCSILEVIFL